MNAEEAVRQMEEPELLTEVPPILKRLAKTVAYAFYDPELIVTLCLITNYPCIDEDTLLEKLQFDKRQLRGVLSKLRNDKLVKQRVIKEKQPDSGNFNIYNFYFINYKLFVNVVKYKLDHIRKKLENEEQQARNRPSFQCLFCHKHYSDLEVDRLIDYSSGQFRCSYCNGEVEEDSNHINTQTKGSSLGRFNEQMEKIYNLLKECENINLAPEVLEPTPSTAAVKTSHKTSSTNVKSGWASANKVKDLYDQSIQINVGDEVELNKEVKKPKDLPIWLAESTVYNEESNDSISSKNSAAVVNATPNVLPGIETKVAEQDNEIMSNLLAHESANKKPRIDASLELSDQQKVAQSSSDSESTSSPDLSKKLTDVAASVTEVADVMDSEDDDENDMIVKVGSDTYELNDITDDIIARMTEDEHQTYLKLYNDYASSFY